MAFINLTGQTLGQYEFRELLGSGGMGAVYRAYQANLQREVAVKVLPTGLSQQPGYLERFKREAKIAAALEHPHIVPILDHGTQDGISYVVMRLLTGGTLTQRIAHHLETDTSMPALGEVALLLQQLGSALDYAHSEGVIHRDIKPGNVMFDNHGNAYLVDFGIAKLLESTSQLTETGTTMGTPSFMSPEQWRAEEITPHTDQYAMGVLAYNLITGRMPFEAPTPYALMHKHLNEMPTPPQVTRTDFPESATAVLERAMAKRPEDRFESMTAFAQAFEAAVQNLRGQQTGFFGRFEPNTEPLSPVAPTPYRPVTSPTAPPDVPTVYGEPESETRNSGTPVIAWFAKHRKMLLEFLLCALLIVSGIYIYDALRNGGDDNKSPAEGAGTLSTESRITHTTFPNSTPNPYGTDIFEASAYNGSFDPNFWATGLTDEGCSIQQRNGAIVMTSNNPERDVACGLQVIYPLTTFTRNNVGIFQAQMRVDSDGYNDLPASQFLIVEPTSGRWRVGCGFTITGENGVNGAFQVVDSESEENTLETLSAGYDRWYYVRLEVDPQTLIFTCYLNGQRIGSGIPANLDFNLDTAFVQSVNTYRSAGTYLTGFVDNVHIEPSN